MQARGLKRSQPADCWDSITPANPILDPMCDTCESRDRSLVFGGVPTGRLAAHVDPALGTSSQTSWRSALVRGTAYASVPRRRQSIAKPVKAFCRVGFARLA